MMCIDNIERKIGGDIQDPMPSNAPKHVLDAEAELAAIYKEECEWTKEFGFE